MSNKAIFLDRDGTLIEDPGYLNHPEQVKLLEGVAEALIELRNMGYMLIVVTNQSAVARGIVSEKILGEIHNRLRQLLTERGAYLDQIYYCPYHPDGVIPKYRKESEWRKPNPGMLLAASEDMDIDLSQSWKIGDSNSDIEAGLRAGCKTILVNRMSRYKTTLGKPDEPKPDYKSVNMKEAVNIIKQYHRSSNDVKVRIQPVTEHEVQTVTETESQSKTETELKTDTEPEPQPVPEPEPQEAQDSEPQLVLESETKPAKKSKTKVASKLKTKLTKKKKTKRTAKPKAKPAPQITEPPVQNEENHADQDVTPDKTMQLLNNILEQLKGMQRADMFGEFSFLRLIAGTLQIIVPFCLLITIVLLMRQASPDTILISLGFAMVLQMMALTFYIMQGRK